MACFAAGTTRLEWPDSAHNKTPAIAIDLFQITYPDKEESPVAIWSPDFFSAVAKDIEDRGLPVLWGGQWRELGDRDHFQLKQD